MTNTPTENRLEINGIVQGVGFRPFIYQLANHHGLKGEVANTATGVSLILEGLQNDIRQFIDDIPYDRPKTSMRHFGMCPLCQAEYDDPDNRRFHAQPNACPVCGPRVTLCDAGGKPVDTVDSIADAANRLRQGRIVAIKGLGGFHLAVDATNAGAVARLRRRKHREEKPLAFMCADLNHIRAIARVGETEARLLVSIQCPIVLLEKRPHTPVAEPVSPRNRYFGIMLPYAPLHHPSVRCWASTPFTWPTRASCWPLCRWIRPTRC